MQPDHPGPALRALRLAAGLSQRQVAERVGVRRERIADIERTAHWCGEEMAGRIRRAIEGEQS